MSPAGTSFTRSRAVRVASGVVSFGVVAGFSFLAASPAVAATDADCTPLNTVDATTGTSTDIQTLLTASTPVICLSGTFTLTAGLTYDYDVTIHGLGSPKATLDGDGLYRILLDTSFSHTLTVEGLRLTNGSAFDGGAINRLEHQQRPDHRLLRIVQQRSPGHARAIGPGPREMRLVRRS